jgi:hypothetical protein
MKTSEILEETMYNEFETELVLPEYLYSSCYITNINELKLLGLTPQISNLSWSNAIDRFVFLTECKEYAGKISDSSDTVDSDLKEYIFILKILTKDLNNNNIFIYNLSDKSQENVYVYHGTIPKSSIIRIFSYY